MTTRFCRISLQSGVGKLYIYRAVIERAVTKEKFLGNLLEIGNDFVAVYAYISLIRIISVTY
jgi:hypothetical protein